MTAMRNEKSRFRLQLLIVFVLGVVLGLIASAYSDIARTGFRIGLTVADPNARPLAAPALAMPPQATSIAVEGASSYYVSSMSLEDAGRYFATALPGAGYRQTSQSSAGDRWQALWRNPGGNSCVEIEAQSVAGTEVIRIKTTSVFCQ